jgi:hypothetical protein
MSTTLYRALAGAFTTFCVITQYFLTVDWDALGAGMASSVKFLSFFTILTNIIAAVALLAPVLAPRSAIAEFLLRPSVRTAIAGDIVIVGAVDFLLLRNLSHREGFSHVLELMLHYVTPPLFVIDWALFVPKHGLSWRIGCAALIFPLIYAAWILVHGALTGWYPYPFLDVNQLGYPGTLANIAGLIAIFLVLEVALVALGRRIGPA